MSLLSHKFIEFSQKYAKLNGKNQSINEVLLSHKIAQENLKLCCDEKESEAIVFWSIKLSKVASSNRKFFSYLENNSPHYNLKHFKTLLQKVFTSHFITVTDLDNQDRLFYMLGKKSQLDKKEIKQLLSKCNFSDETKEKIYLHLCENGQKVKEADLFLESYGLVEIGCYIYPFLKMIRTGNIAFYELSPNSIENNDLYALISFDKFAIDQTKIKPEFAPAVLFYHLQIFFDGLMDISEKTFERAELAAMARSFTYSKHIFRNPKILKMKTFLLGILGFVNDQDLSSLSTYERFGLISQTEAFVQLQNEYMKLTGLDFDSLCDVFSYEI